MRKEDLRPEEIHKGNIYYKALYTVECDVYVALDKDGEPLGVLECQIGGTTFDNKEAEEVVYEISQDDIPLNKWTVVEEIEGDYKKHRKADVERYGRQAVNLANYMKNLKP